ncbi:MAG: hypothetical protein ISR58_02265 [Anaerolineales bacterium]|nr:hypothetical protein [Chloroflexota bacterium]MBL6979992.1 hypothetical protein [Anaerolineales bacterium]
MYNIQIYIETCEDQTASTPKNGKDERSLRKFKDGKRRRLEDAFRDWVTSSEERYLKIQEFYNGR